MNEKNKIQKTLHGASQEKYGDKYNDHLLSQYLQYLGMADKISDRRSYALIGYLAEIYRPRIQKIIQEF